MNQRVGSVLTGKHSYEAELNKVSIVLLTLYQLKHFLKCKYIPVACTGKNKKYCFPLCERAETENEKLPWGNLGGFQLWKLQY